MTGEDLITVRLLGVPVREQVAASQHFDDLLREFSYLDGDDSTVPARLLRLRAELSGRYDAFTAGTSARLVEAIEAGVESIDLEYVLPASAADAATHLGDLLDAADEFCRQGEHLLTLATPPGPLRFRRWFLAEFKRQADGMAPIPWWAYAPYPAPPR